MTIVLGIIAAVSALIGLRSLFVWFRKPAQDFPGLTPHAARTEATRLRAEGRKRADDILGQLPLDPSDEEAERLLREAEATLKRAKDRR